MRLSPIPRCTSSSKPRASLYDPVAGQPGLAGQDRLSARAPDRTAAARGAPSYASFGYRAESWTKSRRVVAKVEWHPGELYLRVGFIVTNLARPAETCGRLLQSARHGGTVDQRGQGRDQVNPAIMPHLRRRCRRLQLHVLVYNEGRQPRPLRLVPTGRGRGVATDVRRDPVADRPTPGTAPRPHYRQKGSDATHDDTRGAP
jgi:Transposase DDE domain group 1